MCTLSRPHAKGHLPSLVLAALALVVTPSAPAQDEPMSRALTAYEAGEYQQALEIWLLRAYEGDAEAQFRLGQMFADGTGTVADPAEAAYWYTRSAEQGNAAAQYALGNAWFHGAGVNPDRAQAMEWWQLAAENGHAEAQYQLGRAYFYGFDLAQDSRQAMTWFTRAAENGSEPAREFLGRIGSAGDAAAEWTGYGRVGDRAIWVYASFNRLSPILRKLDPGDLVRVIGRRGGWFRVQVPGGVPVWLPTDSIAAVEDGHRVVGVGVQARPDPNFDPDVKPVGMFLDGDRVVPLETRGDWVRVHSPESISGWVEAIDVVEEGGMEAVLDEEWTSAGEEVLAALDAEGRASVVLPSPADVSAAAPAPAAVEADSGAADTADGDGDGDGSPAGAAEEAPVEVAANTEDDATETRATPAEGVATEVAAGASGQAPEAEPTTSGQPPETVAETPPAPAAATVVEPLATASTPATQAEVAVGDYLRIGPGGGSLYARDRLSSARIERMPAGLLLRVVGRSDDWVEVEVPGGLPLWIYSRFIEHDGQSGRITGQGVRARPLPSTSSNSQPIGVYPQGATVRVISESDQWVRIRAPENLAGWSPLEGLVTVDLDDDAVAAEWQQQGNGAVTGVSGTLARVAEPVREESQTGDVTATVEPAASEAVAESAATRVAFGRQADAGTPAGDEAETGPETGAAAEPVVAADGAAERAAMIRETPLVDVDVEAAPASVAVFAPDEEVAARASTPERVALDTAVEASAEAVAGDAVGGDAGPVDTVDALDTGTAMVEQAPARETAAALVAADTVQATGSGAEEARAQATETPAVVAASMPADAVAASVVESTTAGSTTAGSTTAESTTAESTTAESTTAESTTAESTTAGSTTAGSTTAESTTAGSTTAGSTTAGSTTAESTTAGSATAGSATPETSTVAEALSIDDLAWLYRQSADAFAIEVLRDASREQVVAAAGELPGDAWAFSSRVGEGLVYHLLLGAYADLIEVQQALGSLPDRFDAIRIRRLGAVQQQWCGRLDNLTPEQLSLVVEKCARPLSG